MADDVHDRFGLPLRDDAEVERALALVMELPEEKRVEWTRLVLRYMIAYRRSRQPSVLEDLAKTVLGSLRLRRSDEARKRLAYYAEHPMDPSRAVEAPDLHASLT